MMYAKYAFAVVMAAVAVRAEDDIKGNSFCDSSSSCNASACGHSSSLRSCGAPSSCGWCCESLLCPSDKVVFNERYAVDGKNPATFVAFYPEEIAINGAAASKDEFAPLGPKTEKGEAQPFEFYTKTGAFKVTEKTASAERQPGAEEELAPAGKSLTAGSIVVGWKSTDGRAYLLAEPKENTDLGAMIKSNAKNVAGFYVLDSSMKKDDAADSKSESENSELPKGDETHSSADDAKGEEAPAADIPEEPASSKMMYIIIAVVVVAVIAAALIGYFVMAGGDDAEEEEETDEEAAEEA